METMVWRKAKVGLDGEEAYDAEITDSLRWNGFECPRFTREVTEQIVRDIDRQSAEAVERGAHPADMPRFDWDGDVLVLSEDIGVGDTYVERLEPDADGMYHLGSHGWVWTEVVSGS